MFSVRKRSANVAAATKAAHRTPPGSSALCESEAAAANVLSVRKRSGSNKVPSRNGNQPYVMVMPFNIIKQTSTNIVHIFKPRVIFARGFM
ncbi:hypothetical protein [Lysinibacillus sp. RC79]|uniref:hypothetical protein n=1 Tax=Lysinibacillus sp. RC79 TaxID=3156296 RepID=UPI003512B2E1